MDLYGAIVLLHVIGTILGTGGATMAEVNINTALKDKQVSLDERALLHGTYTLIRVGMLLIVISVIAMMAYHIANDTVGRLLVEKVWFKEFLFVIIIANAVAISNRWVPLWLGAATSFTSWWVATILGVAGYLPFSFTTFLIGYLVALAVVAGTLHLIREYQSKHTNA